MPNMKGADLKAFRKVNKLTQERLGEYLGIKKSFISTIESGKDPMPQAQLTKLLDNPHGWDVSMLTGESNGLHSESLMGREMSADSLVSNMVGDVLCNSREQLLMSYLQEQVKDKDSLIRELYQKIGMLEAKLELARKGEIVTDADGSLSADAV